MDDIKTRLDKIADSYQLIYTTTDNAIVFPNIASWELNNKITRPVRLKTPSTSHPVANSVFSHPSFQFSVNHCCCNNGKCSTSYS